MMTAEDSTFDFILVAVDGSRPSQVAGALAIQIAQRENMLIQGLAVVDELLVVEISGEVESGLGKELGYQPGNVLTPDERANLLEGRGDAALRWLEDRCRAESVPVEADLVFGGLPDLIIKRAQPARLLALGRRGHNHSKDTTYLGHHFRAVAHHTATPLLIGGEELNPIRRILLAYDGSLPAKHALTWAGFLQRIWGAHLLVLSVAGEEMPSHWREEMEEQVATGGFENYRFIDRQGDPAAQIVAASVAENVDLIVMGGHQHSALREWFTGSTLDKVLQNTRLPIFVTGKQV